MHKLVVEGIRKKWTLLVYRYFGFGSGYSDSSVKGAYHFLGSGVDDNIWQYALFVNKNNILGVFLNFDWSV